MPQDRPAATSLIRCPQRGLATFLSSLLLPVRLSGTSMSRGSLPLNTRGSRAMVEGRKLPSCWAYVAAHRPQAKHGGKPEAAVDGTEYLVSLSETALSIGSYILEHVNNKAAPLIMCRDLFRLPNHSLTFRDTWDEVKELKLISKVICTLVQREFMAHVGQRAMGAWHIHLLLWYPSLSS